MLGPQRWALACAGMLLGAVVQAASVQEAADPLLRQDTAAPAAGGGALERALNVDTHAGQHNLDLLLEARRASDAPVEAGPRRTAPVLPQALPAGTATPGVALPAGDDNLGMPGSDAPRDWLGSAPGGANSGAGLLVVPGGTMGAGPDLGTYRGGHDGAREIDPALRGAFFKDALQFLREHRMWLLGGLLLVAAVAAAVHAWTRRVGATPESRAQRLADIRSETHTDTRSQRGTEHRSRRRSSRRS